MLHVYLKLLHPFFKSNFTPSSHIFSSSHRKSKPPPSDEEIKVDDLPVQNLLQHEIPQDIIDLTDTNSEPLIEFTSSSPSLSSTTTNDRSPKKRLRNEQGTVMDYFKKQKKKNIFMK